jgi:hypothetical protein
MLRDGKCWFMLLQWLIFFLRYIIEGDACEYYKNSIHMCSKENKLYDKKFERRGSRIL